MAIERDTEGRAAQLAQSSLRAVNLRRARPPEIEITASPTYDFLISLHVALSAPDFMGDYDVGRMWIEEARERLRAADAAALATLNRYLGNEPPESLHATLISLVSLCPAPREVETFLDWLPTLPAQDFAEALLDQDGLGDDWREALAAALATSAGVDTGATPAEDARRAAALARLVERYPAEMRATVTEVARNLDGARAALLSALRAWNTAVFAEERQRIAPLLQRQAALLERQRAAQSPEQFIKEAMRGVEWQRPAGFRRIVFAPSYFCRPAVFYHFWRGALTFCTPVEPAIIAEAEARPSDPRAPDVETRRFFEALGDPTRLRILRLLAEREMYLTELAERLGLTKATTKHHMIRLRAAGLVTLYDRDRLTYYALRPDAPQLAAQLLGAYLELP